MLHVIAHHFQDAVSQRRLPKCVWLVVVFHLVVVAVDGRAEQKADTSDWQPNAGQVAKLGDEFTDDQIRMRLPKGFTPLPQNPPNGGEAAKKAGLTIYGWTATSQLPSTTSVMVMMFPPPATTDETLDDFVTGLNESVTRQMQNVTMGKSQAGKFHGVDARRGSFKGTIPNVGEVRSVFLVFIDTQGTVAITATLPADQKGEPTAAMLAASLLTFARAK